MHIPTPKHKKQNIDPLDNIISNLDNNEGKTSDEILEEHRDRTRPKWRKALGSVITLTLAIAFAFGIRFFVVTPYEIPSASMEHTLEINDRIFAEKVTGLFGPPKKGDIVTFKDPEQEGELVQRTLIKRVIAVGGQTVDLKDGQLYVNNSVQTGEYVQGQSNPLQQQMEGLTIVYPYTVPEGYVWVMGDNRENSLDSRYFGPIKLTSITGHAFFTYWPFDRAGLLK